MYRLLYTLSIWSVRARTLNHPPTHTRTRTHILLHILPFVPSIPATDSVAQSLPYIILLPHSLSFDPRPNDEAHRLTLYRLTISSISLCVSFESKYRFTNWYIVDKLIERRRLLFPEYRLMLDITLYIRIKRISFGKRTLVIQSYCPSSIFDAPTAKCPYLQLDRVKRTCW